MNLTLEVAYDDRVSLVTFYTIDALAKADDGASIIFLNGKEFYCSISYDEMWTKLKKIKDESAV